MKYNIPNNHKKNLVFIKEQVKKIDENVNMLDYIKEYKPKQLAELSDKTMYYLDKLGEMSRIIFEQRDIVKNMFYKEYKKAPELGKKLFLDYNAKVHEPYDKLKNKCWKILESIEKNILKHEHNENT